MSENNFDLPLSSQAILTAMANNQGIDTSVLLQKMVDEFLELHPNNDVPIGDMADDECLFAIKAPKTIKATYLKLCKQNNIDGEKYLRNIMYNKIEELQSKEVKQI